MRTFGTKGKIRMGAMIGLVAAGLAPGSSGLAGDAAWAGEYVFDRLITNGATHDSTENPTDQAWSPGQLGSVSAGPPYGGGGSFSIRAKSAGSVAAVFKWQPSYDGDVPEPDSVLWVKATSVAYLGANANAAMTLHDLQVSNGYGDAKQPYAEMTETNEYWRSYGERLVRKATNGQQEVTLDAVTLTAGGRLGGSDSGWIGAYLSYSVEKVTRGLTLHRDGAIGERTEGDTTYGDTTYSHYEQVGSDEEGIMLRHPNWQTFRPVFEGDWATGQVVDGPGGNPVLCEEDVTPWHWSPAGGLLDGDRWNYHTQKMELGGLYVNQFGNWDGAESGSNPTTITYTATVKDKYVAGSGSAPAAIGTATAKYVLTLHEPIEKGATSVADRIGDPRPVFKKSGDNGNNGNVFLAAWDQWIDGNADGEPDPRPITATPTETSQTFTKNWSGGGGVEFTFPAIKDVLGFNVSGTIGGEQGDSEGPPAQFPAPIPYGYYTYWEYVPRIQRETTEFRHFKPEGECKLGEGPAHMPHTAWVEEEAGMNHQWAFQYRRSGSDPVPMRDTSPPPEIPGDPD